MPVNQREEALVLAAQNSDTNAFEELYQLYYDKIYALIMMTVKNSADTEDILQLTFIKAWRNITKLNDPKAFNTWLQRIALNESKSMLRKKRPELSVDDEGENGEVLQFEADMLLPQEYAERDDLSARLRRIIEELSVVQRDTILLYYYNEMSVEEIAQIMECSEGTVKSRLYLARKAIKTEIEEQERKSGEKFYGAVLLPFGPVFNGFVRSQALSPEAALRVWGAIHQSIAGAAAASAAGTAATTAVAKTGLSLGAKIAIGVIAGIALIGGAAFGISQLIKPQEPAAPASSAVIAEQADETRENAEALTEEPTKADYTEAYVRYLNTLQGYKGDISLYNWQINGGNTSNHAQARPIVFADIYGDPTPEMILFAAISNPNGDAFEAKMHVFTFEGGHMTEISKDDFSDIYVAAGTHYYLFTVKGEKALYCYHTMADTSFNYHIDRYTEGDQSLNKQEYLYRYHTEEHEDITKLQMNGETVSINTYSSARKNVLDNVDTVLMAGYSGTVEDDVRDIMEAKGNTAMTYDEAVSFLSSNITEPKFKKDSGSSASKESILSTMANIYISEKKDRSGGSAIEITADGKFLILPYEGQNSGDITILSDEGNGVYQFGITSERDILNGEECVYYPADYPVASIPQKDMELIRELRQHPEGNKLDTAYIVGKRGDAFRLREE